MFLILNSKINLTGRGFDKHILYIKNKVEKKSKLSFNSCLINLYKNGMDSMSYHADNEKELGPHPLIASVSFGEARDIIFKEINNKDNKIKIKLHHASLLVMAGHCQSEFLHTIPKRKNISKPRLNLTFRKIIV